MAVNWIKWVGWRTLAIRSELLLQCESLPPLLISLIRPHWCPPISMPLSHTSEQGGLKSCQFSSGLTQDLYCMLIIGRWYRPSCTSLWLVEEWAPPCWSQLAKKDFFFYLMHNFFSTLMHQVFAFRCHCFPVLSYPRSSSQKTTDTRLCSFMLTFYVFL